MCHGMSEELLRLVIMMSSVETEQVLVVPTAVLHEIGYFQGFTSDVKVYRDRLLDPAVTSYRPRSEMEEDPNYKQLIPYCIFRHQDQLFHLLKCPSLCRNLSGHF